MQCFTATDIGLLRDENQDRVQAEQFGERWLAVVCDGMGGERSGSQASEIAIRELFDRFRHGCKPEMDVDDVRAVLLASVSAANSVIYTTSRMDYRCYGMGTTCVAAFVERECQGIVPWCNGSTTVFGTVCPCSNRGGTTNIKQREPNFIGSLALFLYSSK